MGYYVAPGICHLHAIVPTNKQTNVDDNYTMAQEEESQFASEC
jgi:hypothetical protein